MTDKYLLLKKSNCNRYLFVALIVQYQQIYLLVEKKIITDIYYQHIYLLVNNIFIVIIQILFFN